MPYQQSLFSTTRADVVDHDRTGGLDVAVDSGFASAERIQLDETSWIVHVHGWLSGDDELMRHLMTHASWEQRSRWMYNRVVDEPRLTAEYPVITEAPHPVLRHLADELSGHFGVPYSRLWMNWYRDHTDAPAGTRTAPPTSSTIP